MKRLLLPIVSVSLFGAIGGPLSYWAGMRLEAMGFSMPYRSPNGWNPLWC